MSVRRAQEEISSSEFAEWQAFYALEPFGEERSDFRAAIVAATVANSVRTKGRAWAPSDFMPDFDGDHRRQRPEEIEAILRNYCQARAARNTEMK